MNIAEKMKDFTFISFRRTPCGGYQVNCRRGDLDWRHSQIHPTVEEAFAAAMRMYDDDLLI